MTSGSFKTPLREGGVRKNKTERKDPFKTNLLNDTNDKSDYKKRLHEKLNKWSYFDSNMNNTLVE